MSTRHPLEPRTRHRLIAQRDRLETKEANKHIFLWVVHDEKLFKSFRAQAGFYTGSKGAMPIQQAVILLPEQITVPGKDPKKPKTKTKKTPK